MRPSNAHRWMTCGGSVALCAASPNYHDTLEDTAKEEGIAAHWVFEQLMRGYKVSVGQMSPNHVIVDEEMLDAAKELQSLVPQHASVEQRVDLSPLGMTKEGKRDVSWHADGVAHILDYKYGHRSVDEFENWQLLCYGCDIDFTALGVTEIHFHIYQPRCYAADAHRVWKVSVEQYLTHYLLRIEQQVAAINAGNGAFIPTQEGCYNCPAAASCMALAKIGYAGMDYVAQNASPAIMNNVSLARELDALDRFGGLLKARLVALEEQANHIIRQGGRVPGWERVQGTGRLAWTVPVDTAIQTALAFGVDVQAEKAAITPTQAIAKGMPESVVNSLAARPAGKVKLTKVDNTLARKVFSHGK